MSAEISTTERLVYIVLKLRRVFNHQISSFGVEGIIGIRLQEEGHKSHKNVRNSQTRVPLGTEDVQAYTTVEIDVRVVYTGFASNGGSVVRITLGYVNLELELGTVIETVLRDDSHLKMQ
jgi:hypothetical protein